MIAILFLAACCLLVFELASCIGSIPGRQFAEKVELGVSNQEAE